MENFVFLLSYVYIWFYGDSSNDLNEHQMFGILVIDQITVSNCDPTEHWK